MAHPRALTPDESRILGLVATLYGPANTLDAVTFSDSGDAILWAREADGAIAIMVNLTNVALFAGAGALSDEQVIDQWLRRPP